MSTVQLFRQMELAQSAMVTHQNLITRQAEAAEHYLKFLEDSWVTCGALERIQEALGVLADHSGVWDALADRYFPMVEMLERQLGAVDLLQGAFGSLPKMAELVEVIDWEAVVAWDQGVRRPNWQGAVPTDAPAIERGTSVPIGLEGSTSLDLSDDQNRWIVCLAIGARLLVLAACFGLQVVATGGDRRAVMTATATLGYFLLGVGLRGLVLGQRR